MFGVLAFPFARNSRFRVAASGLSFIGNDHPVAARRWLWSVSAFLKRASPVD
jgi:hypothetical protein